MQKQENKPEQLPIIQVEEPDTLPDVELEGLIQEERQIGINEDMWDMVIAALERLSELLQNMDDEIGDEETELLPAQQDNIKVIKYIDAEGNERKMYFVDIENKYSDEEISEYINQVKTEFSTI